MDDLFDIATVAADMNDCMPPGALETVQLESRTGGDAFAAPVAWPQTRRKPGTASLLAAAGYLDMNAAVFQLYVLAGQTVVPQEKDRIVDGNGATWQVEDVAIRMMSQIYDCSCVLDVG